MKNKIIHISSCEKFLPTFIELVNSKFDINDHDFYLTKGVCEKDLVSIPNVIIAKSGFLGLLKHYLLKLIKIQSAKKVILHGMVDNYMFFMLFLMPWTLRKCYWVIWGGDLYKYLTPKLTLKEKFTELIKRQVFKNIGNLVTYIEGDVQLAREWYGAKGKYHECFMYTSNLYKEYDFPQKQGDCINILLGNSADPSNNHLEVFDKLEKFKGQKIKIYVPLSYGNQDYAKNIIEYGKEHFGDCFYALTKHMLFDKYLEFLAHIDIAIFNHNRQQAMGNTITLLGLGKKVYMRNNVTQWEFFQSKGITIYDIEKLELDDVENEKTQKNKILIKNYFSVSNLERQIREIFSDNDK